MITFLPELRVARTEKRESLGVFPDIAAACRIWVDPLLGETDLPDHDLARRYDALFPVYQAVHRQMRPIWRDLAEVRREFAHAD